MSHRLPRVRPRAAIGLVLIAASVACSNAPPTGPATTTAKTKAIDLLVDDGQPDSYYSYLDLFLAGAGGYGRHVTTDSTGRYRLTYDPKLYIAPFIASSGTGVFGQLGAVTIVDTGRINLTPLTQLVAMDVLGGDPMDLIGNPAPNPPFQFVVPTDVTAQKIAAAQTEVADLLFKWSNITIKPANVSWTTLPYARVTGDPMHESLRSIYDAGFDFGTALTLFRQNAAACTTAAVYTSDGTGTRRFCPSDRRTAQDPDNPAAMVYTLMNVFGDTLVVHGTPAGVSAVTYQRAGRTTSSCAGAACIGVTLGAVAGDGSRSIAFVATALSGTSAAATLAGTIVTQPTGGPTGILNCIRGRGYVSIKRTDGSFAQTCVYDADARPVFPSGRSLYSWNVDSFFVMNAYLVGTKLTAFNFNHIADPSSDTPITYLCIAASCNGIVIEPDSVNNRKVTFANTRFQGYRPDGSGTGTYITVNGALRGMPKAAPEKVINTAPCTSITQTDSVAFQVTALPTWQLCVAPYDSVLNVMPYKYGYDPQDGLGSYYYVLGAGALFNQGTGGIFVKLTNGVVVAVSVGVLYDNWSCDGAAACAGVTITDPDADNKVSVTFRGVQLQEVFGLNGLPAGAYVPHLDRRATLNGTIRGVPRV